MDINLIKTFLELNRTRHFGRAADNLCLTQSAVSARIRLLEEQVGAALFVRQRNNIELTPAGVKFLRYAETLLTTWTRALQDVSAVGPEQTLLAVGGTPSLWDIFLQDWLEHIYGVMPDLSISAEVHHSEVLFRKLLDRTLDLVVGFDVQQTAEVEVVELRPVEFVLVSTRRYPELDVVMQEDYVYVDWGTFFAIQHAQSFPDMPPPRLRVQTGSLAWNHILRLGGGAYLARSMVQEDLTEERLFIVPGAPVIKRMTYAGFLPTSEKSAIIREALGSLMA